MHDIDRQRLIGTFLDLVKIPSPSWKERAIIEYITRVLRDLEIPYELFPCGESHNLLARMGATVPGTRGIALSCHMDTVVPCDRVQPVVTPQRISSDGSTVLGSDDKAAVAALLETMRVLQERKLPHGPVEFLFSCAEELGLYGIKGFNLAHLDSKFAFVLDSGGRVGRIILEAPYQSTIEVFIKGKAAHAGMEPEKGVSAIRVLSGILSSIPHGRIDKQTTANIGLISGGKATNIVAQEAWAKIEVRSIDRKKLASIESKIYATVKDKARAAGAKARLERRLEYSGFSLDKSSAVVRMAEKAVKSIGCKPAFESSGGGSDTNIINKAGIKAVNLSVGMMNVHTTNEYIMIRDLVGAGRLALALVAGV
ncbi:MAG: M20/M25/M40 family metallo-hydrolase [Spirochaetes bacterium]|nr:MAG: M20/M25/M40 family metallo-hydrolase [Spirochaetota bacterium]